MQSNSSLNELRSYSQKYLNDWENKSTIRTQKRSRSSQRLLLKLDFSVSLKPYAHLPEIKALKKKQLRAFYLQSYCDLLYGVANFEVNFVTDQCGKLANQDLGIELSDSVKQVAIAIGIDEMYHAFVARELLSDLKTLAGITPTFASKPVMLKKTTTTSTMKKSEVLLMPLEYFKNAVPPKLQRIAETTLLCILENALVDDFIEMAKHARTDNPADVYAREHLHDESRHKVFFQHLLKYIWSAISEKNRVVLGRAIAGYFVKYMTPNEEQLTAFHRRTLEHLGLPVELCQSIANKLSEQECKKQLHELEFIKNPMRLMKVAGVSDHPATRRLFIRKHLLAI
jgi:hypothetical protein